MSKYRNLETKIQNLEMEKSKHRNLETSFLVTVLYINVKRNIALTVKTYTSKYVSPPKKLPIYKI